MVELKGVSFCYKGAEQGVCGVRDVDLRIGRGECVVLCGRSGCGKTTLTRLVNGLIPHYYEGQLSGSVTVDGAELKARSLAKIARLVGSVFQNPRSQFFNVDTTAELAFGCENQGLPRAEVLRRIEEAARRFALEELLDRSIFELSGGEKQRIACASVYAVHPEVLVLDEPSSNLDPASVAQLQEVLRGLKEEGKTLLVSEHRLSYLMGIADRFVYLDEGEIRAEYTPVALAALGSAQRAGLGLRALDPGGLEDVAKTWEKKSAAGCFAIRDLECKIAGRRVLAIAALDIPAGELVAVIGRNGAGKSTLAACLCGIRRHRGRVLCAAKTLPAKKRLRASYMVMQDVNHQLFTESVRDELTLNVPEEGAERADDILDRMGIAELAERHPLSLSGGQKQRVAIASALCAGKRLLIYDEPTSGLDYESMCEACALIREAAREAELSLVISHDLEFILHCCSMVLRLEQGGVADFYPLDSAGRARLKADFAAGGEAEKEQYLAAKQEAFALRD